MTREWKREMLSMGRICKTVGLKPLYGLRDHIRYKGSDTPPYQKCNSQKLTSIKKDGKQKVQIILERRSFPMFRLIRPSSLDMPPKNQFLTEDIVKWEVLDYAFKSPKGI